MFYLFRSYAWKGSEQKQFKLIVFLCHYELVEIHGLKAEEEWERNRTVHSLLSLQLFEILSVLHTPSKCTVPFESINLLMNDTSHAKRGLYLCVVVSLVLTIAPLVAQQGTVMRLYFYLILFKRPIIKLHTGEIDKCLHDQ